MGQDKTGQVRLVPPLLASFKGRLQAGYLPRRGQDADQLRDGIPQQLVLHAAPVQRVW